MNNDSPPSKAVRVSSALAQALDNAATPLFTAGFIGLIVTIAGSMVTLRDLQRSIELANDRILELEEFRNEGNRWTHAQGIATRADLYALRNSFNGHTVEFTRHEAWGKQWTKDAERRLRRCEENVSYLRRRSYQGHLREGE